MTINPLDKSSEPVTDHANLTNVQPYQHANEVVLATITGATGIVSIDAPIHRLTGTITNDVTSQYDFQIKSLSDEASYNELWTKTYSLNNGETANVDLYLGNTYTFELAFTDGGHEPTTNIDVIGLSR